jgi:hypothetical protein
MSHQYAVKTRFSFTGTFFIKARNKNEAKEFVEKHCGLVLGRGIHSTLPDEDADWDFPMHPEKAVIRIKENCKQGPGYEQTS